MSSQIILYFNQLLSAIILSFFSLLSPLLPPSLSTNLITIRQLADKSPITRSVATPSAQLTAFPSATILLPATSLPAGKAGIQQPIPSTPKPSVVTTAPVPWGTTEKIGEHLYRTYVGSDPAMSTPAEILIALNSYRKTHGAGELRSDDGLCKLAQMRAEQQKKSGTLDSHKGLVDYMNDENHWKELNITAIGENASYGYVLSGVHLIEWIFDSDEEHKSNQLNPQWNLACAGTSGVTVDIIFGRR